MDAFIQGHRFVRRLQKVDFQNPDFGTMLWQATSDRVGEINGVTRDAIREMVFSGLASGKSKAQVAAELDSMLGITLQQSRQVEAMRQRLINQGVPRARANRRASTFSRELQSRRAATIAETEMTFALEAGKLNYWEAAAEAGVINPRTHRRLWIVENDDRVDETCAAMEGVTTDIYTPFDTPVGPAHFPPLHPRCRCAVILEPTRVNARGRGLIETDPSDRFLFEDFPMTTACEIGSRFSTGRQRLFDLQRHEGFTVHAASQTSPTDGWMVAVPGNERIQSMSTITPEWIDEYKRQRLVTLSRPGNHFGGWVETRADGSKFAYLDVSRRFTDFDEAVAFGNSSDQIAIFNLATFETYNLKTRQISKALTTATFMIIPKRWGGKRILEELQLVADQQDLIQKVITTPQTCEDRYWRVISRLQSDGRVWAAMSELDVPDTKTFNKLWQESIDEADLIVNMPDDSLQKVLREGRAKSLFETGVSKGADDVQWRKQLEEAMFGLADDIPDADRPIYGSVGDAYATRRNADGYGNARVVLKDSVRDRTTVTFGDSLHMTDTDNVASWIREVDAAHGIEWDTWVRESSRKASGFELDTFNYSNIYQNLQPGNIEGWEIASHYLEAQIHGGFTVDDIAKVVFPNSERRGPSKWVLELLEAAGVEVDYYEPGYGW